MKSTKEVIGTCLIFFNDDEGHWDISYNLGKMFWSNGYVTEAMSAVMKYAVERMKIKEISTTYAIFIAYDIIVNPIKKEIENTLLMNREYKFLLAQLKRENGAIGVVNLVLQKLLNGEDK